MNRELLMKIIKDDDQGLLKTVNRDDIMKFFRDDEECHNINSLSIADREEILIALCSHSDSLELSVRRAIDQYNIGSFAIKLIDSETKQTVVKTLDQLLDEINRDRNEDWICYNYDDWKDGLQFTNYILA
jgi:predicted DNA binding protein